MKDPYSVLGVSREASLEDVKKAYRALVKKYHPDNYVGNELADLAEEKMKEINEAYDIIVKEKESGSSTSKQNGPFNSGWANTSGVYAQIRSLIQRGSLAEAEQLLQKQVERNAEWYFCRGSLYYCKGWYDEASRCWHTASQMEPDNMEYRQAASYVRQGPSGAYRQPSGNMPVSPCECCTAMLCADLLCNCC